MFSYKPPKGSHYYKTYKAWAKDLNEEQLAVIMQAGMFRLIDNCVKQMANSLAEEQFNLGKPKIIVPRRKKK